MSIEGLSDGPEVAEEEARAKIEAEERVQRWQAVLCSAPGRRAVYDFLVLAGAFRAPVGEREAGGQEVAFLLREQVREAGRDYWLAMLQENEP
jgi:hypothetical protein